ncbi:MAG: PLP-dependent transferase [Hymenobacter sp.]
MRAKISPNTKLIWVETLYQPAFRSISLILRAWRPSPKSAFCALLAVDNTFSTPTGSSRQHLGADIVAYLRSPSSMGGHSGCGDGRAGFQYDELAGTPRVYQNASGGTPGPQDCFLWCCAASKPCTCGCSATAKTAAP